MVAKSHTIEAVQNWIDEYGHETVIARPCKPHMLVYDAWDFSKPMEIPNSLILSAKDKNGKRIETIEIDLKTFKVVQSRGVCNKNTDKHDEIVKLVRDNINLIKQAA